jgi:hypothetical protein
MMLHPLTQVVVQVRRQQFVLMQTTLVTTLLVELQMDSAEAVLAVLVRLMLETWQVLEVAQVEQVEYFSTFTKKNRGQNERNNIYQCAWVGFFSAQASGKRSA